MLIVFPDELEQLKTMQPVDRDIFNYLAERMDYASGQIGRSRKVSYGGIAFDLSERDGERRRPETLRVLSRYDVINSVARLVKCGLLRRLSRPGKHESLLLVRVFFEDLLGKGSCVQKPVNTQIIQQLTQLGSVLSKINNNLQIDSASSLHTNQGAVNRTSLHQQQQGADEKFLMPLDWSPTESDVEAILFRAGRRVDQVRPEWVAEYVAFWHQEGRRRMTQSGWTMHFARRMLDYLSKPGYFEALRNLDRVSDKPVKPASQLKPEWAQPPRDDDSLPSWMSRHGYGSGPPGFTYHQTRNWLRGQIERRFADWQRALQ